MTTVSIKDRVSGGRLDEQAHLAAIVDSSADAIIGKTLTGVVISWNRGAEELYGYSAEEMVGQSILKLFPRHLERDLPQILDTIRRGERVTAYETQRRRKDGEIIDVSLTISPVRDPDGDVIGAATIARDISERKRLEAQLQFLVNHDDLTGLANRRRFTEEIRAKVAHAQRYGWRGAVLLLDLDNFKSLNDALGHGAGDQLIKRAGLHMRESLRESDLLARLGGDEFGILLPEADAEHAATVAQKLVDVMAAQEVVIGNRRVGTVSIGIALLDEPLNPEEPVVRADIAMYKVKAEGGNGFGFFQPGDRIPPTTVPGPR